MLNRDRRRYLYRRLGIRARGGSGPASLRNGLLAFYNLDEASGNAIDSHTSALGLTDTNTVGTGDGVGTGQTARDFVMASSERFQHAWNSVFSIGTNTRTFAAWINPNDLATTRFFAGIGTQAEEWDVGIAATGRLSFRSRNAADTGNNTTVSPASPTTSAGAWAFAVWGYDSTEEEGFGQLNNGTRVASPWAGGTNVSNTTPFVIGAAGAASSHFPGRVQCFAVWDRVLAPEEITLLYNGGTAAILYSGLPSLALDISGAWTWYNDPRAIVVGDNIVYGSVTPQGNVLVEKIPL